MQNQIDGYSARSNGQLIEILDPGGKAVAWAVGGATAQAIVSLLNLAQVSGLLDLDQDAVE